MATGKGTKQVERNKALFNDWASGNFTVKELVEKYHITAQRIYAIVNDMKADILPTDDHND